MTPPETRAQRYRQQAEANGLSCCRAIENPDIAAYFARDAGHYGNLALDLEADAPHPFRSLCDECAYANRQLLCHP